MWRSAMNRFTRLGLLLIVSGALILGQDRGAPAQSSGPQEVTVIGLLLDEQTQQPTIVLQGKRDRRTFAMVIGPAEATGIAFPLQKVTPPRPLTHDLFLTVFGRLKTTVKKAVINDMRDNNFFATLYISANRHAHELE